MRFANGASNIQSDFAPDVRALSFSVTLPDGLNQNVSHQDFSMNDATTFPIKDSYVFSLLFRARAEPEKLTENDLRLLKEVERNAALQQKPAEKGYQVTRYDSGVPYLQGAENVIKYSAIACAHNHAANLNTEDPDALSAELRRHLSSDEYPACFSIGLQFLKPDLKTNPKGGKLEAHQWVEDASLEWSEDQSPFFDFLPQLKQGDS